MNNNETIAKQIWHILRSSTKPWQWGLEFGSVSPIDNGTTFKVHSAIAGRVSIRQGQHDAYSVTILPDDIGGIMEYDTTSSNLVSVIDRVVREGVLVDNREPQGYRIAV